jgi:hypothetical protein
MSGLGVFSIGAILTPLNISPYFPPSLHVSN